MPLLLEPHIEQNDAAYAEHEGEKGPDDSKFIHFRIPLVNLSYRSYCFGLRDSLLVLLRIEQHSALFVFDQGLVVERVVVDPAVEGITDLVAVSQ